MPTYKKDKDGEISEVADQQLAAHETHKPTVDAGVKIDFLFAYGDRDDDGELVGDALKQNGVKKLGICRIVNLKDRTKGLGDVEIVVDGDWWDSVDEPERAALVDHELHHIKPTGKIDALRRPKIKLRKHDFQFGWFNIIAQRHGVASQERQQSKAILDNAGQFYWPEISAAVGASRMTHVTQEVRRSNV